MKRTIDGRTMSAILVAGFSVVIAVNFYAAYVAKQTFGGIVVENSYVASQNYNAWLQQAAEQRALGWTVDPARLPDGRIALSPVGIPAGAHITGHARHPLGGRPDQVLEFDASHISTRPLAEGRWILRVAVRAGDTQFRSESELK